ncbi:MAG: hypothetical protein H6719_29235 [Sandaracinaceae bacterium]|nr:hypothetical protein [Sandaracinaceae bacterium]
MTRSTRGSVPVLFLVLALGCGGGPAEEPATDESTGGEATGGEATSGEATSAETPLAEPSADTPRGDMPPLTPEEDAAGGRVAGAVTIEEVRRVSGDFDEQIMVRMLHSRIRALVPCYERELRADRTLAATVVARLTVTSAGQVDEVTTDADENHRAIGECLATVLTHLRVVPGPEEASVLEARVRFAPME